MCLTCDWIGNGKCIDPKGCNKKSSKQLELSFVSDKSDSCGDKKGDGDSNNHQPKAH